MLTKLKTLAVAAACFGVTAGMATIQSWDLTYEFSGADTPSKPIVVKLDDETQAGKVLLTIDLTQLTGEYEFVTGFYLNYNTSLDLTKLSATYGTDQSGLPDPGISLNAFQPDGDGHFDILISYANSGTDRFTPGKTSTYVFGSTEGALTVADFANYLSVNGPPGKTGFPFVARVQGIGEDGNGSGWVTVPEPSTVIALMLLSLPIGVHALRRMRRQANVTA